MIDAPSIRIAATETFIVVHDSPDGTAYPTDTTDEIALAIEALRANGEESARVYAGDPECPDSQWNGQTLYVPPSMKNERY
jgi:hypothetical protein